MRTTDRTINGVTYERDYMSRGCRDCDAFLAPSVACEGLAQDDCSKSYTFKIKDVTKQHQPAPVPDKVQQGVKYDDNKVLYSLVPPHALQAVAQNLTDGLRKYPARNNWRLVDNAQERYLDALYRHLEAHRRGEIYDTDNINPETTHMSAVAVNSLFLLELMLNPELNKEIK